MSAFYDEVLAAFLRGHDLDPGPDPVATGRSAGLKVSRFKRKRVLPRVSKVLGVMHGLQPAELLDVGPGRGTGLWPIVDAFPHLEIDAVDVLPQRAAMIDAVHRGGVSRLRGHHGSATELPFEPDRFDVCTALEVLEHLPDPDAAAREIVRVTRRFVVASVPSTPDDNPDHLRLFTPATLTALFEQAGARKVQLDWVPNHMIAVVSL